MNPVDVWTSVGHGVVDSMRMTPTTGSTFVLLVIACDNGSKFLPHPLLRYLKNRPRAVAFGLLLNHNGVAAASSQSCLFQDSVHRSKNHRPLNRGSENSMHSYNGRLPSARKMGFQ